MRPERPIALAAGLVLALALPAPSQEVVPPPPRAVPRPLPRPDFLKPRVEPPAFIPGRPETPPPTPAPPTGPTPVVLDFKDQPVAQVIRTLAGRTGGMVDTFNSNDARWNDQRVTLEGPAPVPFWEAIDRLSASAGILRTVTPAGPFGVPPSRVQFQAHFGLSPVAPPSEGGLVVYVGPFRVGPVVVHEHFDRVFLKAAGPAPGLSAGPAEGFFAEVELLAEPNLLATQVGPLRGVEAVDESGQSLAAPEAVGESTSALPTPGVYGPPKLIRVPLARGPRPSKALARLRCSLPLEVARRPAAPTLVVPLAGSSGKTFRDGDVSITVREYKVDAQGQAVVKLSARVEGERGTAPGRGSGGLAAARLWTVYHHQIELADAQSRPVRIQSGGAGQGGLDSRELLMDYTFPAPTGGGPATPTHLRIYRPAWVAWDLPLEFKDIPLS